MYHLKMEKHMNNAKSARMPKPLEVLVGNKNSLQPPQLQVNNQANMQLMLGKAMTTSDNKDPRYQ
jgi:hypothetical protein